MKEVTKAEVVEKLLKNEKITAAEAVVLLREKIYIEGVSICGDKVHNAQTPQASMSRGLLYDTAQYSPPPVFPVPPPNISKSCKCTECKCGKADSK
mgnify:CR=1 FL=1|jgi:hypothetical protein|tara:strand:+ start:35084 stop:35371 length:288 start_codon:yes stop_codon:yes gene_type:complete